MKHTPSLLIGTALITFAAFAQAPSATYGQARSGLLRLRSPLSDEQRGAVAIVMATSYVCGKADGGGNLENTILGTPVTKEDCADVLLTIKSSKGMVK
jgi:hypothetical protein